MVFYLHTRTQTHTNQAENLFTILGGAERLCVCAEGDGFSAETDVQKSARTTNIQSNQMYKSGK